MNISIRHTLPFLLSLALSASADQPSKSVDILYIGDSHSAGKFGAELTRKLEENQHTVATYGVSNSNASTWVTADNVQCYGGGNTYGKADRMRTWQKKDRKNMDVRNCAEAPAFSGLLKKHSPKVVVIALGSNHMGYNESTTEVPVKKMLELIRRSGPDTQCVWVGAPDMSYRGVKRAMNKKTGKVPQVGEGLDLMNLNLDEVNQLLEKLVAGQCLFVNTLEELKKEGLRYPKPSGMHFDETTPRYKKAFEKYREVWVEKSSEAVEAAFLAIAQRSPSTRATKSLVRPVR